MVLSFMVHLCIQLSRNRTQAFLEARVVSAGPKPGATKAKSKNRSEDRPLQGQTQETKKAGRARHAVPLRETAIANPCGVETMLVIAAVRVMDLHYFGEGWAGLRLRDSFWCVLDHPAKEIGCGIY